MDKNVSMRTKLLNFIGNVFPVVTFAMYILGMVLGNNMVFVGGIVCGVIGAIFNKKVEKGAALALCILFAIASGLELFMRVRDGYTGNGWYYLYLLQNPEKNAWYK